jgi:hypothetical protein
MIEPRKLFGGLGNRLFQMAYIYGQNAHRQIPDTYVQDEKYFSHCAPLIKALYGQGVTPIDMVSLHIRRGDYVGNSFYVDLTKTDYYDRALEIFAGDKFLVFCADRQGDTIDKSDREWVKRWLTDKGIDFEMWEGSDEIADFNAMAGCRGHIMANSSFSWWTSYISEGITVCPIEWFSDGKQRISLLDEWIKL